MRIFFQITRQSYYKKSKYANKSLLYLLFSGFCERNFGGIPLEGGVRSTKKSHIRKSMQDFFVILRSTS